MKVTIEFDVDSLEDIQPYLSRGQESMVRALQLEAERLREKISALEGAVNASPSEEPVAGAKDSEGTPYDPTIHSGSKTATGAWRKRRKAADVKPNAAADAYAEAATPPPAPAKPGPKTMSLDEFRAGVQKVVNSHPRGVEAGKAHARETLAGFGAKSMGEVKAEDFEKVLAAVQNIPRETLGGVLFDEMDGL